MILTLFLQYFISVLKEMALSKYYVSKIVDMSQSFMCVF